MGFGDFFSGLGSNLVNFVTGSSANSFFHNLFGDSDSLQGQSLELSKRNSEEAIRQFNENMKFNREQFDYTKMATDRAFNYAVGQDELMRQREDTAYQRAVADASKAGINPLAMTGANPAASNGSAPPAASAGSASGSPTASASGGSGSSASVSGVLGTVMSMIMQSKSIAASQSASDKQLAEQNRHNQEMEDIARLGANTKGREVSVLENESPSRIRSNDASARSASASAADQEYETKYKRDRDMSSITPDKVSQAREGIYAAKQVADEYKTATQIARDSVATDSKFAIFQQMFPDGDSRMFDKIRDAVRTKTTAPIYDYVGKMSPQELSFLRSRLRSGKLTFFGLCQVLARSDNRR